MTWHDAIHDIRNSYPMAATIGRALRDEGYLSPSKCEPAAKYYDGPDMIGAILIWELPNREHVSIECDLGNEIYECFWCISSGGPAEMANSDLAGALQFVKKWIPKVI